VERKRRAGNIKEPHSVGRSPHSSNNRTPRKGEGGGLLQRVHYEETTLQKWSSFLEKLSGKRDKKSQPGGSENQT